MCFRLLRMSIRFQLQISSVNHPRMLLINSINFIISPACKCSLKLTYSIHILLVNLSLLRILFLSIFFCAYSYCNCIYVVISFPSICLTNEFLTIEVHVNVNMNIRILFFFLLPSQISFSHDKQSMTAAGMTPTETNTSPTDQQHLHEHQNEEYEDKVIQEFSHLLEKSKQLFNGLRYT